MKGSAVWCYGALLTAISWQAVSAAPPLQSPLYQAFFYQVRAKMCLNVDTCPYMIGSFQSPIGHGLRMQRMWVAAHSI